MSRPTLYSLDLAEAICERLANDETLVQICADEAMPSRTTVYRWADEIDGFGTRCARAREQQAEYQDHKVNKLSQDVLSGAVEPQAARVALAAITWRAEKLDGKRYGSKVGIEHSGTVRTQAPAELTEEAIVARLAALEAGKVAAE